MVVHEVPCPRELFVLLKQPRQMWCVFVCVRSEHKSTAVN